MTATQTTTTDQNLAAAAAYWIEQPPQPDDENPGPDDDVSLFEFGTPKDVSSPARLMRYEREAREQAADGPAWTDADERAFADEPLWLSGPARYSGPEPCEVCAAGGRLPCEACGAVANGEQYD